MKKLNKNKGITLVALVVTIIVLLILSGIAVSLVINKNGIFIRAQNAKEKHTKTEATEIINLKISGIQIESYAETEQLPTLQYLADKLCNDDEMEYVIKKQENISALQKIDVSNVNSIFTKLKKYPYEFEIDSELKLASIDGVKIAESYVKQEQYNSLLETIATLQSKVTKLEDDISKIQSNTNGFSMKKLGQGSGAWKAIEIPEGLDTYRYIYLQHGIGEAYGSRIMSIEEFKEYNSSNNVKLYFYTGVDNRAQFYYSDNNHIYAYANRYSYCIYGIY